MARGGINKAHVLKARETLLARGITPSIDAVRTELGNTGSKTTIHRYLREIEEESGARLDDEALLSDTLKELVTRLAARLREEAGALVTEAQQRHEAQRAHWAEQTRTLQSDLKTLQAQQGVTVAERDVAQQECRSLVDALQQERLETQRLRQQVTDLQDRLAENEKYRESLEEKHQHAREALDHYRQSVKEQRDQEQRRHDAQIQQLQAEQRQLNQTVIVKQNDITQLNKDNARLSTEVGVLQKQLSTLRSDHQIAQDQVLSWRDRSTHLELQLAVTMQRCEGLQGELDTSIQQLRELGERCRGVEVAFAKAEAQLDAQRTTISLLQEQLQKRDRSEEKPI